MERDSNLDCFPKYNVLSNAKSRVTRLVLRIAILIKLFVKIYVNGLDCLQRFGIKFSIGIAGMMGLIVVFLHLGY